MGRKRLSSQDGISATNGMSKGIKAEQSTTACPRWAYFGLLLLSIAPFIRAFTYGSIHLDDADYITDNAMVQAGLSPAAVWQAILGFHLMNWHPLVWISYMAEVQLFGLNLKVMHATNIFLHAANSLLLFCWLAGITASWQRSILAASLYAVHPQHVESVVWLTERKDVLSTFFLLLTLLMYTRYVKKPGLFHYFAALTAFAFGLSAKGMLVTLPLLMLFLDYWPYQRLLLNASHESRIRLRKLLLEKVPFFALSASIVVLTVLAQQGAMAGLEGHSLSERFANSAVSVVRYLFGYFVPTTFSISYPFPEAGWRVERVVFSVLLILAVTVVTFRIRRSKPAAFVGWLWFTVSLLPVIGLVQVGAQAMADRYMYVPSIGLSMMVGWLVPDAWIAHREKTILPKVGRDRSRTWFATGFMLVIVMLAFRTDHVVSKWSDSITLFSHAVAVEPDNNYVAHRALGAAYFDAGKLDTSADHYKQALQCFPERKEAIIELVNQWISKGNVAKAGVYTKAALQLDESDGDLWFLLGNVMHKQRRTVDAEHCYLKAIGLKPQFSEALHNLGQIRCSSNNTEGMQYIRRALDADPTNAVAWNSLGNALVRAGNLEKAQKSYLEAIRLADLPEAKQNLVYVRELIEQSRRQE